MPSSQRLTQFTSTGYLRTRTTLCNGSVSETSTPQTRPITTSNREKSWSRTPNYRALVKANKALPDLAFEYTERTMDDTVVLYRSIDFGQCLGSPGTSMSTREIHNALPTQPGTEAGSVLLSNSGCIAQLLSNAKGAEFNAPVFFGEAKSTMNMALGLARTLASSMIQLRRGNLANAMKILAMDPPSLGHVNRYNRKYGVNPQATAANKWLELQYGWKPLLNDVKNAAEQMAEISLQEEATIGRVTAFTSLETVYRNPNMVVEVSPQILANLVRRQKETRRAVWRFQPTGLNTLGSLGLLNPLTVAWELLPLSFVVDWMFPIGRYLESLDAPLRFTHKGGTYGYRREVSQQYTGFRRAGVSGDGMHNNNYVFVQRSPITSVPSLGLTSMFFEPKLGVTRFLSGLALASQAFRR